MSYISGYQGLFAPAVPVVIGNGAQASAAINCGGFVLCGIKLPAAFTGSTLTFQVCDTVDGTYQDLYNAVNDLVSMDVAAGRWYAIDPAFFSGVQFLKIKSGSAEGAARTIVCQLRGV